MTVIQFVIYAPWTVWRSAEQKRHHKKLIAVRTKMGVCQSTESPCMTTAYGLDSLEAELYETAKEGDIEGVLDCIEKGVDVVNGECE